MNEVRLPAIQTIIQRLYYHYSAGMALDASLELKMGSLCKIVKYLFLSRDSI